LKRGSGFRVVKPNVHTFNRLMLCCYQNGLVERVKEIWGEMNCNPNAYSYSLLMSAFCERDRLEDSEKLWEEMRMIGGFCKIGDVGSVEEYFRKMGLVGI
jgi:pentatricopeptide repeat protein